MESRNLKWISLRCGDALTKKSHFPSSSCFGISLILWERVSGRWKYKLSRFPWLAMRVIAAIEFAWCLLFAPLTLSCNWVLFWHFQCLNLQLHWLLICCDDLVGVTLKENAPNSVGTLVDVGLNKVWLHSLRACLFESSFFVVVTISWFGSTQ